MSRTGKLGGPGTSIQVRLDIREVVAFKRRLELWASDQLPFVGAAALTDTAKDAASFLRSGLAEHFKLRNKGLLNAIVFRPADKRDRPPRAIVGVVDWARFLELHAVGGFKTPMHGRAVAVPTKIIKRTATGRVPLRQKPKTIVHSKGFVRALLDKRGLIAARARGKGARIFYTLVPRAKIKPRWPFAKEVEETARARLGYHFAKRAQQALKP